MSRLDRITVPQRQIEPAAHQAVSLDLDLLLVLALDVGKFILQRTPELADGRV